MKYRELLEQYINGLLNEEQKAAVEADIERQEAISDYLFDQQMEEDFTLPGEEPGAAEAKEQAKQYTKLIDRAIRRAFLKVGLGTACVILAVVIGLSPLMNALFYNPAETVGKNTNRLSLDWGIWSELIMPTNIRQNALVYSHGYGNYTFTLEQNVSYTGYFNNYAGAISRGILQLYTPEAITTFSPNLFANWQLDSNLPVSEQVDSSSYIWSVGSREDGINQLQELSDAKLYYGYVTFDEPLSLAEVNKVLSTVEVDKVWYAVRTTGEQYFGTALGMRATTDSVMNYYANEDEYPWLTLFREDNEDSDSRCNDESIMTTHFLSMLRYISGQEKFLKMIGAERFSSYGDYTQAISYVEENGLQIYGTVVMGYADALIKLNNDERVFGISVQEVK